MATLYKFRSGTIPIFSATCDAPMTDRSCKISIKFKPTTIRTPDAEAFRRMTDSLAAVLHPNEAVIPLSRGRSIPVEASRLTADAVTLKEPWLDKMHRLRALKPHIT